MKWVIIHPHPRISLQSPLERLFLWEECLELLAVRWGVIREVDDDPLTSTNLVAESTGTSFSCEECLELFAERWGSTLKFTYLVVDSTGTS